MFTAPRISKEKAQKLIKEKNGILVDVRDPVAFRDATMEGAVNMSLRQLSSLQKYPKHTPIILFNETNDDNIKAAANYLIQFNFEKVSLLITQIGPWTK